MGRSSWQDDDKQNEEKLSGIFTLGVPDTFKIGVDEAKRS